MLSEYVQRLDRRGPTEQVRRLVGLGKGGWEVGSQYSGGISFFAISVLEKSFLKQTRVKETKRVAGASHYDCPSSPLSLIAAAFTPKLSHRIAPPVLMSPPCSTYTTGQ